MRPRIVLHIFRKDLVETLRDRRTVVMAFVVPAPGKRVSPESVVDWCRANMANYKVPRRVEVVRELPTNASGKVQKFVLRERARGGAR